MVDKKKLQKLAKSIVNYSIRIQPGEKVLLLSYGFDGYPLIKELYRECIKAGALKVEIKFSLLEISKVFYDEASEKQLKYVGEIDKKLADSYDAMVQIAASENPYELSSVDSKKIQTLGKARKVLSDILHKKKWCLMYYPTAASAALARKSLEEWEDFVLDGCLLDWKKVEAEELKFIEIMKKVKKVRIVGKETDLEVNIAGQKWRACCGQRNLPDGEIFTAPIRNGVNGVIRYNLPSRYQSQEFNWIKLSIKDGKVVKEDSDNKKALTKILNTDEGARYYGEFAFGLNKRIKEITRQTLFDEKMGKSLHMALGKCYEECPNGNDSNIHWDMVFRFDWAKAELFFDGKKVFGGNKWIDPKLKFLN